MLTISELLSGTSFVALATRYFRRPLDFRGALERVAELSRDREARFAGILRHSVFDKPDNPYFALFRAAGCEWGDAEKLLRQDGLESALHRLHEAGIRLSVSEFKAAGVKLRNPRAAHHVRARSGGSRSEGTPVLIDLRFQRDCAASMAVMLAARGGENWVKGDWETLGAGARFRILKLAGIGEPPTGWFSQVDPADPTLPAVFGWNTAAIRFAARLGGAPLPKPQFAPVAAPDAVIDWCQSVLRQRRTPMLFTFPSSAVALCAYANRKGRDIAGARLLISGEPVTEARLRTIRSAGCVPLPRYGSVETGAIAYGCLNPRCSDDMHHVSHMTALIAHAGRLSLTMLHPYAPFTMINVNMGDMAESDSHSCGCALSSRWPAHLREIRSYEKLTGGGVTFLGADVIRILEVVLPEAFGGAPTDYQLVEDETEGGLPSLTLRVHPSVGPLDAEAVKALFLRELTNGSDASRVMTSVWSSGDVLRIERRDPGLTQAGKLLHLHLARRPGNS
ncbi:MAG: hypothetical protein FJW32_05895 [Acidobacteria bacterium]|nr:hypothetical protein [Acidobacteriota bacterium]